MKQLIPVLVSVSLAVLTLSAPVLAADAAEYQAALTKARETLSDAQSKEIGRAHV